MSRITAIIPSLTGVDEHYLKVCVESLRASGFDGDITVVSNGPNLNPEFVEIKGITKRLRTKQQGQCNAVNVGALAVEGDCKYLFVINSDMYFSPGWDKNLPKLQYMPLCFSPTLVEPTNNNGSADPFIKFDGGYTLDEFKPEQVDKFVKHNIDNDKLVEPGFNLPFFIDIKLWRDIGGYDIKYDIWGSNSDTDLQTLINIAGVVPERYRNMLVYHFSNKSGTFDGTHQEEWQKNFDYYRDKFGYTRDDEPKADVWYNKNMVLWDKLKFKPDWLGKYDGD